MAQVNATLMIRKRWFFWPSLIAIVVLGKLRILNDPDKAAKWLADHAIRIEVK